MHTISLEEALVLFQLPRTLGDLDGVLLTVGVGSIGPFVKHGSTYAALGKDADPYNIDVARRKALLVAKAEANANRIINRKCVMKGKRWSVRVDHRGSRIIQ